MGYSRWNPDDWRGHRSGLSGLRRDEVFGKRRLCPDLDPSRIGVRESRDSERNPDSNAVIVALDVTGSMGMVAEVIARDGLGTLVEEILARRPVNDPHMMFMGVGDAYCDAAPLQVTQFEADIRIAQQLQQIWLEGGGGGNDSESYSLPWHFAATRTAIDCFERRRRKGYLFTIGDEMPPDVLSGAQLGRVLGGRQARSLDAAAALAGAERMYHCFHLVAEEGTFARPSPERVVGAWRKLMGQRVIRLSDHRRVAEVIVSAIAINEGADPAEVARSWSGEAADIVSRAFLGPPLLDTPDWLDWR